MHALGHVRTVGPEVVAAAPSVALAVAVMERKSMKSIAEGMIEHTSSGNHTEKTYRWTIRRWCATYIAPVLEAK